jgi:hypothetical protein
VVHKGLTSSSTGDRKHVDRAHENRMKIIQYINFTVYIICEFQYFFTLMVRVVSSTKEFIVLLFVDRGSAPAETMSFICPNCYAVAS